MLTAVSREREGVVLRQYPLPAPTGADTSPEVHIVQAVAAAVRELGPGEAVYARFHFGDCQGVLELSLVPRPPHSTEEALVKWWWTQPAATRAPTPLGVHYSLAQLPVVCGSVAQMFYRASMPARHAPVPFGQGRGLCYEGYPCEPNHSGLGTGPCLGGALCAQEEVPVTPRGFF